MIESFKQGGKVPRRVAWEIILGVKDLVMKEKSLVEVDIPEGVTCDIVGDSECTCARWNAVLICSSWSGFKPQSHMAPN